MTKSEFERIKRYIQFADQQRLDIRRFSIGGWWIGYAGFFLVSFIMLAGVLNSTHFTFFGIWTHEIILGVFFLAHGFGFWAFNEWVKIRSKSKFAVSNALRYDREHPKTGQICAAISRPSEGFIIPAMLPAKGAWTPDMRPIFRVMAVSDDKMLTLQLVRTADSEALGKIFEDVPYFEVEAIEN